MREAQPLVRVALVPNRYPYPMSRPATPFDIKSASITGLALVLRTTDIAAIEAELGERVRDAGDLFSNAPVLIDVSALTASETADQLALGQLIGLLETHTMRAVGIVGAQGVLVEQALGLGLIEEIAIRPRQRPTAAPPTEVESSAAVPAEASSGNAVPTPVADGTKAHAQAHLFDVPTAMAEAPPAAPAASGQFQANVQAAVDHAVAGLTAPTLVIDKPLRSGQRVYARGGDLVVLGVVSHGAEVIADGNIHVYGPLRGRAIAGANGDAHARIFATAMEPELISIAGTYRMTDKPLAPNVLGKPAQARLDGDRLLIEPLKS